jgi:ubiquinone/menaquinone biosynthesis C-methylase UbiE
VQSRIFSTIKDRIEGSIETFFEDIPKFKDVLLPYGISLSGWFLKYAMLFFVAKLFFIEVPMITFIMIMAVADVLACLPISIYGLGTREAVLITIFEFWGIPRENIVSFSLFWFILIWLTPSIIGAFVTVSETKKSGKFELTDKTINRFVSYLQKYPEFYAHTSEIIKKNIPKKVDKPVIIDLGAGPGLLSSAVGKIIPNAQIIAVDPLKKMIEFAKEEVKFKDFKTLIGSSDNIPVADDFADIVVSRFNLTYWEKPRESFEEIDRVLKPGGKVIIEALNKDLSGFKLFLIKINMFLKLASSDVIKYHADAYKTAYRLKDVEGFLKKIGYKITYKEIDEKEWKFIIIAKK